MVTALGVAQDKDGVGMDAITHRRIQAAHWHNLGVMAGLEVSGAAGLRYQAGAGVAVCSTGGADGCVEAYWPGGLTEEAVTAGDSAYERIDSVYLLADTRAGGQVSLHVKQGVPAAEAVPPALPPGALRLRDMRMPAAASDTRSAAPVGSVDYAIPYGASMGRLGLTEDTRTDVHGDARPRKWFEELPVEFYVPTDRMVELVYDTDVACIDGVGLSWASTMQIDGVDVPHSSMETLCRDGVWTHHHHSVVVVVDQGQHTARVRHGIAWKSGDGHPYFHYGPNGGLDYPGRTMQVWDRGPAQ